MPEKNEIKILFFGTPEISETALSALLRNGYPVRAVVTNPDKQVGREQKITFSAVKETALKNQIETLQPEKLKDPETIKQIKNLKADLIVVSAYGKMIPKEILDSAPLGALNIHPSLLPKYRGPSPIQYPILGGDQETGVTIILIDEQMDHGPILAQKTFKIASGETGETLLAKLAEEGANLLIETIPLWLDKKISPRPQDESEATYTDLLTKEYGKINWDDDAVKIERKIRAFHPWPGTYTHYKIKDGVKSLKIIKATAASSGEIPDARPCGSVFLTADRRMTVKTSKGYLILEELQLEGKKPMRAAEFLRGRPEIVGKILT